MSPLRPGHTSRRIPWWVLLVLFVAVPLLEIYVLIQVGQVIGAWWTILLLLADGAFGTWLVRREGRRAWAALTQALGQGRMPSTELADGALVVVGGTLMLAPGFLTDVVGVLCLLPLTRPWARRVLARLVADRLGAPAVVTGGRGTGFGFGTGWPAGPRGAAGRGARQGQARQGQARQGPGRGPRGGDVVRGEVVDED